MAEPLIEIPARRGKAALVWAGQGSPSSIPWSSNVVIPGHSTAPTWRVSCRMMHTRSHSRHLVSQARRCPAHAQAGPILTLTETHPRIHEYPDRILRSLPYAFSGCRGLSRQLHGQSFCLLKDGARAVRRYQARLTCSLIFAWEILMQRSACGRAAAAVPDATFSCVPRWICDSHFPPVRRHPAINGKAGKPVEAHFSFYKLGATA